MLEPAGGPSLSCDLGERDIGHPVDLLLMEDIDIANIACGGHAGDAASVRYYRELAQRSGVAVSAHLSYPDRAGFGRRHSDLPEVELLSALDAQRELLEDVAMVKLHGALYNEACCRGPLAATLAAWMRSRDVEVVITMPGSELAAQCGRLGIRVIAEAFVERRYGIDGDSGLLALLDRGRPDAVIGDIHEAMEQARSIVMRGQVRALRGTGSEETALWVPLRADTLCLHSDSPIAVELARSLRGLLTEKARGALPMGI